MSKASAATAERRQRLLWAVAVVNLFLASSAESQIVVKASDDVFMRIGFNLQTWADEQQDAATGQYAQNLFLRRARLLLTGQVAPKVTFRIQTDNANAGKTPKTLGSGSVILDAWAEWKITEALALSAGEFVVPLSRAGLMSSRAFLTLDIAGTANVFSVPTQSNASRDTGFQAKGYVADGRLEYRADVFQGIRASGGHSAFRHSAYLQYDFYEKERGYTYPGTNLGQRKIVAISTGVDSQNTYESWSGSLFANLPVKKGDEVAAIVQHNGYDGGTFIKALPNQRDELIALGYYVHALKLQPFAKWEQQKFSLQSTSSQDQNRWAGGAHYYIQGQNLKITGQYFRVMPARHGTHATNEFTVELQVGY